MHFEWVHIFWQLPRGVASIIQRQGCFKYEIVYEREKLKWCLKKCLGFLFVPNDPNPNK